MTVISAELVVAPGPPPLVWATFDVVGQVGVSSLVQWMPLEASMRLYRARCAGVSGESWQLWPNKQWRRSAIMCGRSFRPVFSLTAMLLTWSNHLIPKIRRCEFIWKFCIFSLSTFLTTQASDPHKNTDITSEVYSRGCLVLKLRTQRKNIYLA